MKTYGSFPATRPRSLSTDNEDEENAAGCLSSCYHNLFVGQSNEDDIDAALPSSSWSSVVRNWLRVGSWSHEELVVAVFVLILLISSTSERIIFKAAVDDMAPFRAVLMIFIFLSSCIIFAVISVAKRCLFSHSHIESSNSVDFPQRGLMFMAIVDTVSFGGLVLTATGVSPTKTVILMHAGTPCVVMVSKFIFSNRKYSYYQMAGVSLITAALVICLSEPFLDYIEGTGDSKLKPLHGSRWTPTQGIRLCSALAYTFSAGLQGLGGLVKEKSIIDYSLPTDIHTMSCWLFFYQFIFSVLFFPLFYYLQGIASGWSSFPLSTAYENFIDGLHCSLGTDPDPEKSNYATIQTSCSSMKWLIGGYVLATVLMLLFIDKLIVTGNKVLPRCTTFAVLTAFIAALVYSDMFASEIQDSYFGLADFVAVVILLIGMETYSRDPEPEPEMVTNYSPLAQN